MHLSGGQGQGRTDDGNFEGLTDALASRRPQVYRKFKNVTVSHPPPSPAAYSGRKGSWQGARMQLHIPVKLRVGDIVIVSAMVKNRGSQVAVNFLGPTVSHAPTVPFHFTMVPKRVSWAEI